MTVTDSGRDLLRPAGSRTGSSRSWSTWRSCSPSSRWSSVLWTGRQERRRAGFDMEFLTHSMSGIGASDAGGGAYHAIIGTLEQVAARHAHRGPDRPAHRRSTWSSTAGGSRLARPISFFVDVMTGIPSIVAGPVHPGVLDARCSACSFSGFAGALALSILMMPVVVRSAEEMLKLVPNDLREASYALGVPRVAHDRSRSCCRPPSPASSPASCSPSPASPARPRRCC